MNSMNRAQPKVVVVGAYNADLRVSCETPLVPGKSITGGPLQIFGGGRGANCAVAAARAECTVSFIGACGRDGFGEMAKRQLTGERINLDYFVEVPHANTGTTLNLVEANTGKHFLVCAESANDHVTPKMIQAARDIIISADLVISELEIPRETVWELMKLCEQHSRPFVLDISPLNRTDRIPESNILLVVSESIEEAMSITKTESPSYAMEELHRLGCQNVILIDNSTEVTFSDQRRTETISVPIACIVDRCGATECLETWTALSLIRGASLAEACREAVIATSYSLSCLGGHQGMPRRSEIVELAQRLS
jgi:ribokinase